MTTLSQQKDEAKAINWSIDVQEKVQKLTEESKNDIDLYIKIINGTFQELAHEEFCIEKAQGLWDAQNVWIGG